MAESFMSQRIQFSSKNSQKQFLKKCFESKSINRDWGKIAHLAGVHPRTIQDWTNGRFRMSHTAAIQISQSTRVPIPPNTRVMDLTTHLQKISTLGGKTKYTKYGVVAQNETLRKNAWRMWWNKKGKNLPHTITKSRLIQIPPYSTMLAEFTGIMLGDGGVAPYHISITLHSIDDKKYALFVQKYIVSLFGVVPKSYPKKNTRATTLVVARKQLSLFCQKIGLPLGNKVAQAVDIPDWIRTNQKFTIACLRGLFDTDGSYFFHTYVVNGQRYCYLKISFSSASFPLILSVLSSLQKLGIHARVSRNRGEVRIESAQEVLKFIDVVGTHNPKHQHKINGGVRERFKRAAC